MKEKPSFIPLDSSKDETRPDDDLPDLTSPAMVALFKNAKVKRGRPRVDKPKKSTTLRIDADVLEAFKATGKGWQTRINEVLRAHTEKE